MTATAVCMFCGAPTVGLDLCDTDDCAGSKPRAEAPDPWDLVSEPERFDSEAARRRSRTRRAS